VTRPRLSERLGGTFVREHLSHSIDVLLIGRADDLLHGLSGLGVSEDLLPDQFRTTGHRNKPNSQGEVWSTHMFDDDLALGLKLSKDAFVWVVLSIGAVHDELPLAANLELENLEGVGKALRPPPLG